MLERVLGVAAVVPFLLGAASARSAPAADVAFTFQDPAILESSGLAVAGGYVVTTNDSGDTGRLFTVDPATGETVGTTDWSDDPTDVEALAPRSADEVWVGDIGDNLERRASVQVTPVRVGTGGIRDDTQPTYDLVYPDGPHDAESLVADPATGRLYVATKGPLGGTLYAAPASLSADGPNELEPVGDVLPLATDGTFLADGTRLVVRNYAVAVVYAFPSMERLEQVPLPGQEQGEGLALDPADGSLLLSSEGARQDVLRVAVPATAVQSASATTAPSPSASPSERTTISREDRELPTSETAQRPAWPWFLSGMLGLGFIVILAFSLRRR